VFIVEWDGCVCVQSYMEDHLQNKNRLNREWEALSAYEAEPNDTSEALEPVNLNKNRYSDILPCMQ
jgi:receptor-type tyrosine-protein phosphatase N